MSNEHLTEMKTAGRRSRLEAVFCLLDHPDKVLRHPRLTRGEKRALLSSWASDAHAVENQPTLRRLDDGTVLPVDEILRALKSLDEKLVGGQHQAFTAMKVIGAGSIHDQSGWSIHSYDRRVPPQCP
jgi:hypothetical protein